MKYTKEQLEAMSDKELSDDIKSFFEWWRPNFDINNPNDMMPLAFDNGISQLKSDEDELWCCFNWKDDNHESWHINPLRAAAIVYILIMQEKAK